MALGHNEKAAELAVELSEAAEVKGRSLWRDARVRFFQNKAAVAAVIVLGSVILFTLIGPYFARWSGEEIDWVVMGDVAGMGGPSIETGHYFGVDDLGRDQIGRAHV